MKRLWWMQGPLREENTEGEGGGDGPKPLDESAVAKLIDDRLKAYGKGLDKKLKPLEGLPAAIEALTSRLPQGDDAEGHDDTDDGDTVDDKAKGKKGDGLTPQAREAIRKAEKAAKDATERAERVDREAKERAAKVEAKDRESRVRSALTGSGLDLVEGAVDLALPVLLGKAKRLDPEDFDSDVVIGDDDRLLPEFTKEWLTEGPGKVYVKANGGGSGHKGGSQSGGKEFDLSSFVPGQATDEQRAQLRAAMRKAAGL